ncbi:maturation control protein, partial [Salmonella enterica]|nr:maturation control protein [Salmonella enterica]
EYNNTASADFIKSMTSEMYRHHETSLIDPMLNIIRGVQRISEKRVPQGKLTGKGNIL